MYEVPLPTTVGASLIGDPKKPGSRVTGAPSQKYPILRDLAESPATITLEIDTERKRYSGVLRAVGGSPGQEQALHFQRGGPGPVALSKIIAFRVLKIEVEDLPAVV